MTTHIHNSRLHYIVCFLFIIVFAHNSEAQKATNSVFVNFGRQNCGDSYWGSDVTLFADAQSSTPDLLLQCNSSGTIGNVFSKFIGYNQLNNRVYINDISDGVNSHIYILNLGLPANLNCPSFSLSYTISNIILNQFEFDALGDLYAISNYDPSVGTAYIGAYDDTTGLLQSGSLKTLIFPSGYFPTDILNGDITFTPNGRMFAMFGGDVSKLYEITNYQKGASGTATATYLGSPSTVCYGIAFDNGYLLMGGTDLGGSCWSFTYNLSNGVLSSQLSAPNNSMPIDDTSFSPSISVGEKLVSSSQVDATHYDITYQIYIKNLGNCKLGKVQLTEDLASVFGSANISNISASFISNMATLTINSGYNGNSDKNLLAGMDNMPNYPAAKNLSVIQLKVRVANAIPNQVYNVSAKFSGRIGKDSTLLTLADSSNNYSSSFSSWTDAIDPNKNNVSDDPGEGVPTPWMIGMLMPIELSAFDVHPENGGAMLNWSTLSEKDTRYFAIERSADATSFDSIGIVQGTGTTNEHDYSFFDKNLPNNTVYYRLRGVSSTGSPDYSEVKSLEQESPASILEANYSVYPNPASHYLVFETSATSADNLTLGIYTLYGVNLFNSMIRGSDLREQITLPALPNGSYIVAIKSPEHAPHFYKISINN